MAYGKHGKRSRTESLAAVYGYVYDDEYASPYETDQDYKADAADAADLNKLSKRTRAEENTDLLGAIFNSFRGVENDLLGPDEISVLAAALEIDPNGPVMMVIAWHMNISQLGCISRREFIHGMQELKCVFSSSSSSSSTTTSS
eukprot:CAMPEP_0177656200 /NCGR_PEP_ID=MMETSP0447-20121125/15418_1 /TAXON_ID=0 /ORGANISM="Stygamoeba regulata, Strain BSH-02190019" /LENGTH=143 /DNA_ID=CAMNT_0019160259 /DNA_START=213 /DNA_END=644 /DNA_ORIENTATION=+